MAQCDFNAESIGLMFDPILDFPVLPLHFNLILLPLENVRAFLSFGKVAAMDGLDAFRQMRQMRAFLPFAVSIAAGISASVRGCWAIGGYNLVAVVLVGALGAVHLLVVILFHILYCGTGFPAVGAQHLAVDVIPTIIPRFILGI